MKTFKSRVSMVAVGLVAMAGASSGGVASAATLTYTDSFGPAITTWDHNLSVQKFNTTLGTLTSIFASGSATMTGSIFDEGLGATGPQNLSLDLAGIITIKKPNAVNLVVLNPDTPLLDTVLGAYDGATDYAGSSGFQHPGLSATDPFSGFLVAGDFAMFSFAGVQSALLATHAAGASSGANDAGGISLVINQLAAASVTVTYTYTPFETPPLGVPEPSSMALFAMGGGLIAMGLRGKFRRRK